MAPPVQLWCRIYHLEYLNLKYFKKIQPNLTLKESLIYMLLFVPGLFLLTFLSKNTID